MTAQGLREAELAVCEISTGIPCSNDNAIMHNTELHLFCVFILCFFDQTIAHIYVLQAISNIMQAIIITWYRITCVCGVAGTLHFI